MKIKIQYLKKLVNTKNKKLKEKNNQVQSYRLPDIEWIKKDKKEMVKDLIPKSLGWSINVIGKTGSGKTICIFIIFNWLYLQNWKYLLSSTFNQIGWDRIRKNFKHINNIDATVDIDNSNTVWWYASSIKRK